VLCREILNRIKSEFLEMPGLRLPLAQVTRFCGVERSVCKAVLDALVDAKVLCLKSDGRYVRLTEGRYQPPQSAMTHSHERIAS